MNFKNDSKSIKPQFAIQRLYELTKEKNAFILSDRGTYLSFLHRNKINLRIVFGRKDKNLLNVYSVIQVNPIKHKNILYNQESLILIFPSFQNNDP